MEIKLKTLHNAHYGMIENLNEKNELKGNDFLLFLNRKPAIKKKVKWKIAAFLYFWTSCPIYNIIDGISEN